MRHAFSSRGNNSQHHHQQQQQVDRQSQPLVPQLPPQLPPVGGSQPRRLSEAACVPSQALHHSGTGQAGSSSQAAEQQQRRTLKTSKSAANIGKMAASAAAPPPLLDFDFGSSLLTPESLRKSSSENGPGLAATAATGAQGFLLSGSGSQAAGDNSSQSYLIDYINHDYSDGASCMSADYTASGDSYSRQSVARRIINKNTQVRQTQYEYNFGSQIFDCFDNDFMLLKTDAFNAAGGLDAPSSSLPSSTPAAGTGSGRARPKQGRGAAAGTNRAGGAARKKNVDSVTAAAAYTAAAINSLVANSSKARASVATTTTGDAYQQHRVLIPSALK
ncbi:hypothetical protein FBU59_006203 [Linderina macrospora]|uniref:Uncharacterized protein n=1 Tax=Linderina macrospora TaxID=4868 RepID=A0ACC1J0N2_9FUNG|nr:hypothetical protein FBU59_006203 [Linderina macrospora]